MSAPIVGSGLGPTQAVNAIRTNEKDERTGRPRVYLLVGIHGGPFAGGADILAAYASLKSANRALKRMPQARVDQYEQVAVQRVLVKP